MSRHFTAIMVAYGRTERKLHRDPAGNASFRIDDQTSGDTQNGFCQISLTCDPPGNLTLELRSCPTDAAVREFILGLGGSIKEVSGRANITWPLPTKRGPQQVKELALLIRHIVGRGRTYLDSNLKWLCPRTADSLVKFAVALKAAEQAIRPSRVGT